MSEIGDRIRSHREAMDITQTDLASTLGISKSYLSHIEAGRRKVPPGLAELIFKTIGHDETKMHDFVVRIQAVDLHTTWMEVNVRGLNFRTALRAAADLPTPLWTEVEEIMP